MTKCLICNKSINPFISFGRMPIANGFLTQDQFQHEYFFDLKVGFCENCNMVQLTELVDQERMFNENYAFFSSTSTRMAEHFKEFAELVQTKYIKSSDPFVVEIGSNDGILLRHFAANKIRHLGIEPSANVAQIAKDKGINTITKFFDEKLASEIIKEYGQADVFMGANVMCHIPYLHSVAAGIDILLKPEGILIFEDPYLGDILEKTSYDQIYDEHAFYFSVTSISYLFEQHNLEVIDVQPQSVHGGSMRYIIAHRNVYDISENVVEQRKKEEKLGISEIKTYLQLKQNIEKSRKDLLDLLVDLKQKGKRVVGYAATSKSTTVINYCGITPELVEYISDTTPIKQGKYTPGAHIPVRSHDQFKINPPDYTLLFGWNHMGEIMEKEQSYSSCGGKWIIYVPQVKVL